MIHNTFVKILIGLASIGLGFSVIKWHKELIEWTRQAQGLFDDSKWYRGWNTFICFLVGTGFVICGCVIIMMTARMLFK